MTIEQTMIKNMKRIGRLTHERGISESVLMTLSMVAFQNVYEEVKKLSGTSPASFDQHIDMR